MNIFVVCVLQVSCHMLIQPVEVYMNWYMIWYLKRYILQGTYHFWLMHHFSNGLSIIHFSVGLAAVHHPVDTFNLELIRASVHAFVCMLIITVVCAIV